MTECTTEKLYTVFVEKYNLNNDNNLRVDSEKLSRKDCKNTSDK